MTYKIPKPYIPVHKPTVDGIPSVYYIETVLACNLACPECVIGRDAVTRIKKILNLNWRCHVVMIFGIGKADKKGIYGERFRINEELVIKEV